MSVGGGGVAGARRTAEALIECSLESSEKVSNGSGRVGIKWKGQHTSLMLGRRTLEAE